MTTLDLPAKPFRVDLATLLQEAGRAEEADQSYSCGCGRVCHASGFRDVRDKPDDFGGRAFVCEVCASELERQELVAWEAATRAAMVAAGQIPEEELNALRAIRDRELAWSDHTQLLDRQEDFTEAERVMWREWRASVRAWFTTARDTGSIGDLPARPS